MATVDETVRENILCWPSLFSNRTEVLYSILCVVGNGYIWKNGEPVYRFPEENVHWTAEAFLERELKDRTEGPLGEFYIEWANDFVEEYQRTVDEIEERIYKTSSIRDFYQQSNFCLLTNIPKDITEDWAAACEELRNLAIAEAGWVF